MKNWISFLGPFFAALAGALSLKFPETVREWVTTIVTAVAAGFGGLGAKSANAKRDRG